MAIHFTKVTTDRFQLRHFEENDIHKVYEALSHPEVIKYYGVKYGSLSETEVQMAWFKQLEEEEHGIWLAITSPTGETFYGGVGLNHLSKANRKAEIGLWLLPAFWGKGLMREAAEQVCAFGFEQLLLHRIEAFVESQNQYSKHLLNELGFKHEGMMSDCEVKDGRFISLDIYAKLAPEVR